MVVEHAIIWPGKLLVLAGITMHFATYRHHQCTIAITITIATAGFSFAGQTTETSTPSASCLAMSPYLWALRLVNAFEVRAPNSSLRPVAAEH